MLEIFAQVVTMAIGLLFIFGVVVPAARKSIDKLPNVMFDDPVTQCQCYVEQGCSHVNGMDCEMKTCSILKDYRSNR